MLDEVIKLVNELGSPFCITYLKYLCLSQGHKDIPFYFLPEA